MAEKSVQGLAALVLFDAKLMARTGFTSEIVTRQEVGGESSESIVDFPHRQGKCGCPGSASVCCCLLSWWRGGRRRPSREGACVWRSALMAASVRAGRRRPVIGPARQSAQHCRRRPRAPGAYRVPRARHASVRPVGRRRRDWRRYPTHAKRIFAIGRCLSNK